MVGVIVDGYVDGVPKLTVGLGQGGEKVARPPTYWW
jgi:hypothetical protein